MKEYILGVLENVRDTHEGYGHYGDEELKEMAERLYKDDMFLEVIDNTILMEVKENQEYMVKQTKNGKGSLEIEETINLRRVR